MLEMFPKQKKRQRENEIPTHLAISQSKPKSKAILKKKERER